MSNAICLTEESEKMAIGFGYNVVGREEVRQLQELPIDNVKYYLKRFFRIVNRYSVKIVFGNATNGAFTIIK